MSDLVDKAKEIARQAHEGQTDKARKPYIEHPAFVASMMETDDEKVVAWLHDVLEDTDIGVEYLSAVFPPRIITALDSLTHRTGESYEKYIERISLNPLAVKVKIADLTHNMDLTRLSEVTIEDSRRAEKYKLAYVKLVSLT